MSSRYGMASLLFVRWTLVQLFKCNGRQTLFPGKGVALFWMIKWPCFRVDKNTRARTMSRSGSGDKEKDDRSAGPVAFSASSRFRRLWLPPCHVCIGRPSPTNKRLFSGENRPWINPFTARKPGRLQVNHQATRILRRDQSRAQRLRLGRTALHRGNGLDAAQ